jgi:hypothetical protein
MTDMLPKPVRSAMPQGLAAAAVHRPGGLIPQRAACSEIGMRTAASPCELPAEEHHRACYVCRAHSLPPRGRVVDAGLGSKPRVALMSVPQSVPVAEAVHARRAPAPRRTG